MSQVNSRRNLISDVFFFFTGTHMWFVVKEVALGRVISFALIQPVSLHQVFIIIFTLILFSSETVFQISGISGLKILSRFIFACNLDSMYRRSLK